MIVKNLHKWHKAVCEREGYICRGCNKDLSYSHYFNDKGMNQYAVGHHYPHTQKARPDLKFDVNNGVCLCAGCHTKAHAGTLQLNKS